MKCPKCNSSRTAVKESRVIEEGFVVRRRRVCDRCSFRFSTREVAEILDLTVVKKDGRRESYRKEKLEAGVQRAMEKREKSPQAIRRLIARIEREVQQLNRREVSSRQIGEIVMKALKAFDRVAYIRFASVYRSFSDVDAFQSAVKDILKKRS